MVMRVDGRAVKADCVNVGEGKQDVGNGRVG